MEKKDDTGWKNTLKKERHGTGEVVGVRQSLLGAVGKHPERSSFLTAVVRKNNTEGQRSPKDKIWALKNSRRVTSVATWKGQGETTRQALPEKNFPSKGSIPARTRIC